MTPATPAATASAASRFRAAAGTAAATASASAASLAPSSMFAPHSDISREFAAFHADSNSGGFAASYTDTDIDSGEAEAEAEHEAEAGTKMAAEHEVAAVAQTETETGHEAEVDDVQQAFEALYKARRVRAGSDARRQEFADGFDAAAAIFGGADTAGGAYVAATGDTGANDAVGPTTTTTTTTTTSTTERELDGEHHSVGIPDAGTVLGDVPSLPREGLMQSPAAVAAMLEHAESSGHAPVPSSSADIAMANVVDGAAVVGVLSGDGSLIRSGAHADRTLHGKL
ncbi:hypothetical protein GQ42DRAFT_165748 [Ramicandelaber brevisporus]|nr:hypothetical protein GQ42DRAFT_165748 [Ramicandelaber brevisporus]